MSDYGLHFGMVYEISGAANRKFGYIWNSLNFIFEDIESTGVSSSVPILVQKLRPPILSFPLTVR